MEKVNLEENKHKKQKIIFLGLLVHILLLLSVFDVYFSSPLDHGMRPVKSTNNPPAKRVILFIADGLRAQAIFEKDNEEITPFLTSIKYNNGSWGISHTRVPTETRPGHVAMLAGIYEDPSAIFSGWQSNPIKFDSVINQSTNTWAWGHPDVVNIFNRDNLSKIHTYFYEEDDDFAKNDSWLFDTWVFDRVDTFLKELSDCKTDCGQYYAQGNIFLLHLLGLDTAGHGFKPHSTEYINNIKLVDRYVKETVKKFNSIFPDNSNAFIFTSDHGMSDWGSHGTGLDHETQTPIIAWGAGIRRNKEQQDIEQIDITPLIAALIGINIPTNSLGALPVDYLRVESEILTEMILSNIMELIEIFKRNMLRIQNYSVVHLPFKDIAPDFLNTKVKKLEVADIDNLKTEYKDFIKFLKDGIHYYHNYYQYPVLIATSLGFLMWILFLFLSIFGLNNRKKSDLYHIDLILLSLFLIVFMWCKKSRFPVSYYLYFQFPLLSYFVFLKDVDILNIFSKYSNLYLPHIAFYAVGLELLIYGFFNRASFTVIMILVGLWIYLSSELRNISTGTERVIWLTCCLIISVFPSLPVMLTSFNMPVYFIGYLGYLLIFAKIYICDLRHYEKLKSAKLQYQVLLLQLFFLQLALIFVVLIEYDFISSDSNLKYISWIIFLVPILVIPVSDNFIALRLASTVFGFAPFYFLVSSNYEVLFSVFYVFLLYTWLHVETKTFRFKISPKIIYYRKFEDYKSENAVTEDTFRRAFLFIVFILLGFFGTGNIASVNSFDPMWVRAFMTVYSPFKMMGLILFKFTVPFIFACSVFRAINEVGKQNILNIFCIILMFSDLMVLQFLYLITNEGSWADIGSSLSHFIIMDGFVIILLILYGTAYWLTSVRYKYFTVM